MRLGFGTKIMDNMGHIDRAVGQRQHKSGRICAPGTRDQSSTLSIPNSRSTRKRPPLGPHTPHERMPGTGDGLLGVWRQHQTMIAELMLTFAQTAGDAPESVLDPQAGEAVATGELQATDQPDEVKSESSFLSTVFLGFGTMVLMIMIFRMLKSTSKARSSREHVTETPRETINRHRCEARSACEPLEGMMADADELARNLARMLDAKATRLELLLAEAETRIAELEQKVPSTASPPPKPSSLQQPAPLRITTGSIEDQVLTLSAQGCDTSQIAARVGRSVVEVDLILAVRQRTSDG